MMFGVVECGIAVTFTALALHFLPSLCGKQLSGLQNQGNLLVVPLVNARPADCQQLRLHQIESHVSSSSNRVSAPTGQRDLRCRSLMLPTRPKCWSSPFAATSDV